VESLLANITDVEFDEILEARKKRKKKIKKQFCYLFPPFYGKGDGKSAATAPPNSSPSVPVSSPAFPGPGGINSPGVASGPNSGMGPA